MVEILLPELIVDAKTFEALGESQVDNLIVIPQQSSSKLVSLVETAAKVAAVVSIWQLALFIFFG